MNDPIHIRKDIHGQWHGKALRLMMDMAEPGQYRVTLRRWSGRKSVSQNSYLHVLFGEVARVLNAEQIGDGTKWTVDKVKDWCKAQGCYVSDTHTLKGVEVHVPKRTRDLTKEEAGEVIENVHRYWAEHGIILPEPNTQLEIHGE